MLSVVFQPRGLSKWTVIPSGELLKVDGLPLTVAERICMPGPLKKRESTRSRNGVKMCVTRPLTRPFTGSKETSNRICSMST